MSTYIHTNSRVQRLASEAGIFLVNLNLSLCNVDKHTYVHTHIHAYIHAYIHNDSHAHSGSDARITFATRTVKFSWCLSLYSVDKYTCICTYIHNNSHAHSGSDARITLASDAVTFS
jgi:hypothetical protein